MSKYYIYLARLLSACCFYLFMAKANTWLDITANTILAFGYRFFILLAPLFFLLINRWIAFVSFLVGIVGILFWLKACFFIGTLLFSSGMAVGGYVLKFHASKTPHGAANNRVALNLGVFFSGLIILIPTSENMLMLIGLSLMILTLVSSLYINNDLHEEKECQVQKLNFSFSQLYSVRGTAWAIIGIMIGIKLMSTMAILPQYLIGQYGNIPQWYGLIISMSSLVVVILQIPIMHVMKKFDMTRAFIPLILSMILIAFPAIFYCETIIGAMIWTFVLTIFECGASYLDVFSVKEGTLLIKEFFVGIGMALTVLCMRNFNSITGAFLLGSIGLIGILFAMLLLKPARAQEEVLII